MKRADRALNDFGLGEHAGLFDRLADDQRVARAAFVHHDAILDRRALDVDDAVVRIDVLRAVRARVTVGAQPQVIFADLRDALFALAVANVFDETIGVRDRGRTGERRVDADHRAERVAGRAHHAVRDVDELLHVVGRDAAFALVRGVGILRLQGTA